jgi:hypothetical protein
MWVFLYKREQLILFLSAYLHLTYLHNNLFVIKNGIINQ